MNHNNIKIEFRELNISIPFFCFFDNDELLIIINSTQEIKKDELLFIISDFIFGKGNNANL